MRLAYLIGRDSKGEVRSFNEGSYNGGCYGVCIGYSVCL